jgi:hypothetical protein
MVHYRLIVFQLLHHSPSFGRLGSGSPGMILGSLSLGLFIVSVKESVFYTNKFVLGAMKNGFVTFKILLLQGGNWACKTLGGKLLHTRLAHVAARSAKGEIV